MTAPLVPAHGGDQTRRQPADVDLQGEDTRGTETSPSFVYVFLAFIVANMFSGRTAEVGLNVPIGPDRALFGLYLLLLILDKRASWGDIRWRWLHALMVLMVSVAALSGIWVGTLLTPVGAFALIDRLVVPYLVFVLAPVTFARRSDRLLLLKTLSLVGLYLGVTAIGEVIGPSAIVQPSYILDPSIGSQPGRARGPFAGSEANGLVMVVCFFACLVLWRVGESQPWKRLAAVAMALTAFGVLLCLTRSIWIGFTIALIAVAVVDARYRRPMLLIGVTGAAVVVLALTTSPMLREKVTGRAETSRSVDDRRNTNEAGLRMVEASPLLGVGWSRSLSESINFVRQADNYPLTRTDIEIHNVVLSRAAELGVPAAGLWVLILVRGPGAVFVRKASGDVAMSWRLISVGATACWVFPVLFSPVPYPLPNTLVWLLAGIALSDRLRDPLIQEPDSAS